MNENCYRKVKDWAKESGKELPDSVVRDMGDLLQRLHDKDPNFGPNQFRDAVADLIEQYSSKISEKYKQAKKIAIRKHTEVNQSLDSLKTPTTTIDQEAKNFKDWFHGATLKGGTGTNLDPLAMQAAIKDSYYTLLHNGLSKESMALLNEPAMMPDIFREMGEIQQGRAAGITKNKYAAEIADVLVNKLDSKISLDTAEVNPFFTPLKDRFFHQEWKREKVAMFSKEEFTQKVLERNSNSLPDLDLNEKIKVVNKMYDDILSGRSSEAVFQETKGFIGKLMSRQSMGRKIVPNDWKAALETMQMFGYDSIGEAIEKSLTKRSIELSLMHKFSSDPEQFLNGIINKRFKENADVARDLRLFAQEELRKLRSSNAPSSKLDYLVDTLVVQQNGVHLGKAVISSQADLALGAAMLRGMNGHNILSNAADLYSTYLRNLTPENRKATLELIGMMGQYSSGRMQEMLGIQRGAAKWSEIIKMYDSGQKVESVYHGTRNIAEKMGKLNLMNYHIDSMRGAFGLLTVTHAGEMTQYKFIDLPIEMQNTLSRYGLSKDWDTIRGAVQTVKNPISGRDVPVILARNIEKLGTENASEMSIKFATMINQLADIATSTPGARELSWIKGNSKTNEVYRTAHKLFWQFKSSALAATRGIGRIAYSGEDPLTSSKAALGSYMGLALGLGGLISMAKDLVDGKEPEDPISVSFMQRAMLQSGVWGIYSDVLNGVLADNTAFSGYKSIGTFLIGPAGADIVDGAQLLKDYGYYGADQLFGEKMRMAPNKQLSKMLLNQVPNIMVGKQLADYYILNGVREYLNAGSLVKQEMRLREKNSIFGEPRNYFMFKPTDSNLWIK